MLKTLLIIHFIIRLYAHKNIFQYITEKYGQEKTTLSRSIEKKRTRLKRIKGDLKFLTTCKRNKLIPMFARPKISIKTNYAIRWKIATTIIDAEIRNKQRKQNKLKNEVEKRNEQAKKPNRIHLLVLSKQRNQ